MQDLENAPAHQTYKLGKYTFVFPKNLPYELFEANGYRGICFLVAEDGFMGSSIGKYQIVDNLYLGFRILTQNKNGWSDIPFKKETFLFLPPMVKVIEEE